MSAEPERPGRDIRVHTYYQVRLTKLISWDNLLISKSLKKSSETFAYKARADLDIKIDVWRDF